MTRLSFTCLWLAVMVTAGCAQTGPAPIAAAQKSASAAELKAAAATVAQQDRARFARADRDGDGFLTPAELPHHPPVALAMLDADRDGRLSFAEATAAEPDARARAQAAADFARAARETEHAPETAEAHDPSLDGKRNPVIFVPGFLDFEIYFGRIKSKLEAKGRTTHYLSVFPNVGDIKVAALALKSLIAEVKAKTGAKQVDVVAHSMGGLITRYYIKNLGGEPSIERLVTLATPHHGTIVSYLAPTTGAEQMHPGSDFLNALNAGDETPGRIQYTSIRGGLDEIVIPHSSPILEGAENHYARFAAHGTIFIDRTAWRHLEAALAK